MLIKTQRYIMTGSGSLDHKDIAINSDEISSASKLGYEDRPYTGLTLVSMKNGDRFYTSLKLEDL